MIGGIAGTGHMLLSAGVVLLFLALGRAKSTKLTDTAARPESR